MYKPVEDGHISSDYGDRQDPSNPKVKQFHPGIDIAPNNHGTNPEVRNVWESEVYDANETKTFGNRVWVKLLDGPHKGFYMVYAHLDSIDGSIKKRKLLREGDIIGIMGDTGLAYGVHVHIEIRPIPETPGNSRDPKEIIIFYPKINAY